MKYKKTDAYAAVVIACLIAVAWGLFRWGAPREAALDKTALTGSEAAAGLSEPPSPTPANRKVAYLTFDDGPSARTQELLEILRSRGVCATFFVVGRNAEVYPDALRQMTKDGDVVGVHSWTHDYSYIYASTKNFLSDFLRLRDFIEETTGVAPTVYRFPGGTNNTVSLSYNENHIMKSLVPLVENMGFRYYDWNVSAGETWSNPPSKEKVVESVVSQCREKKTAVILFHDTGNQGYVDAVPEIISRLSALGFTFDTLSSDSPSASRAAMFQFAPS